MSEPIIDLSRLPQDRQEDVLRSLQAGPSPLPLAVKAMPAPLVAVFEDRAEAWCQGFTLVSVFDPSALERSAEANQRVIAATVAASEAVRMAAREVSRYADDVRRAQQETFEGGEVGAPIWTDLRASTGTIGPSRVDRIPWEAPAMVRRDRHRRLFGHPLARVFILGHRLAVVHPGGAA